MIRRVIKFVKQPSIIMIFTVCAFFGCIRDKSVGPPVSEYIPPVRFAVISDVHYFDPALGTSGTAFETYIAGDRKMIAESEAILTAAVNGLLSENVQFVLVAGDLTKDGELASHQKVADYFKQLENAGIQVYITPGNHDINNPNASSYSGDDAIPVESVPAEQFAQIYGAYGFDEALERDDHSLSYVVQPVDGFRILAIDCCRYNENTNNNAVAGGALSVETRGWIRSVLEEASENDIRVFGMMHHGLLEHFDGQKLFFSDYVIDDYQAISSDFAEMDMRVVFTGHFHAQDIVTAETEGGFLFDIETGSLVTYPCPYRVIDYSEDILSITSNRIMSINYDTQGMVFQEYAYEFLETGMYSMVPEILVSMLQFSQEEAAAYAPHLVAGIVAHTEGDETPSAETLAYIDSLRSHPDLRIQLVGYALDAVWNDPSPVDNQVMIDLMTGSVVEPVLSRMFVFP